MVEATALWRYTNLIIIIIIVLYICTSTSLGTCHFVLQFGENI